MRRTSKPLRWKVLLAESQGHHPDIYLSWGEVRLTVWTHKIDGLTESDFIFAAKADRQLTPVAGA